jgi:pimeloyl-ACP methyl ester carboxylesterase
MTTIERTIISGPDTLGYTLHNPGGDPLVLVHGWGSSRHDWDGVIDALGSQYAVLALDNVGHGASTTELDSVTIVQMAEHVLAAMDDAGVVRAAVAGHSMGGAIAAELAARHPERVSVLIAVDSLHYLQLYPKQDEASVAAFADGFAVDFPASVEALIDLSSIDATPDYVKERVRKSTLAIAMPLALTELLYLLRWDMDATLVRVATPIVSIVSEDLVSEQAIERYKDRMTFVRLAGVSHYLTLEDPAATAAAIASAAQGRR